ncbi:MAG: hypothetical protein IJ731_07045 [Eubacterium sp.]|nr:hypothetical protein [Eubacterium sp.]
MSNKEKKQTISSMNNFDVDAPLRDKGRKNYKKKYRLSRDLTNKFSSWASNPTVQPDGKTEMGVPIPTEQNVEYSKEYQEENEL